MTKKPGKKPPKKPASSVQEPPRKRGQKTLEHIQEKVANGFLPFPNGLSDKHMLFCKRYVLNGGNASKASRESGFDEWYGGTTLIKHPMVIAEVERYRAERAKKFDVNAERIIMELVRVAFGTLGSFIKIQQDGTPIIDCQDIGEEEMASLSEITQDIYYERTGADEEDVEPVKKTKIKLHNKVQALEQLGRIFRLFEEGGGVKETPEAMAAKIRKALLAMTKTDNTEEAQIE
jgi:hypothetical protein